jgi:hypothetical protein
LALPEEGIEEGSRSKCIGDGWGYVVLKVCILPLKIRKVVKFGNGSVYDVFYDSRARTSAKSRQYKVFKMKKGSDFVIMYQSAVVVRVPKAESAESSR